MIRRDASIRVYLARTDRAQKDSPVLLHAAAVHWATQQGIAPSALTVTRAAGGKPVFADLPEVCLSVSHSGVYWCCAIACQDVGLDIQQEKRVRTEQIACRFFHPLEQMLARRSPASFFAVWTAKESYTKFTGTGIDDDFAAFSVTDGERITPMPDGAQFRFLPAEEGYTLCLCARDVTDVNVEVLR